MLIQQLTGVDVKPVSYKLGKTNAEINIDTPEENTNTSLILAQQACRNINIFTQDLDAEFYDNTGFVMAVSQLALRDSRAIIRILVQDSMPAIRSEHRLLALSNSVPGSVFIRNPTRLYHHMRCSYMVADSLGYVYRDRPHRDNYEASVNFMAPGRAAILDDNFMRVWEKSTVDRYVKRLYI